MEALQAIILGIVQGITEWLPVSSEGVAALVMVRFFGATLAEAVPLALWLHAGTLLAAIVYYRADVWSILRQLPSYRPGKKQFALTEFLAIATIISVLIGGALYVFVIRKAEISGAFAMAIIGVFLIITGVMQLVARKIALHKEVRPKDGLLVGFLQGFSIIPGVSRSGTTVFTLLLQKYSPKDALRLSFLLSIPLVAAAQVGLQLTGGVALDANSFLAMGVSFVVGLASIAVLMKVAEKVNFGWFAIALGVLSVLTIFLN